MVTAFSFLPQLKATAYGLCMSSVLLHVKLRRSGFNVCNFLCGTVLGFMWLFAFTFLRSYARAFARLGLTRGGPVSNKQRLTLVIRLYLLEVHRWDATVLLSVPLASVSLLFAPLVSLPLSALSYAGSLLPRSPELTCSVW